MLAEQRVHGNERPCRCCSVAAVFKLLKVRREDMAVIWQADLHDVLEKIQRVAPSNLFELTACRVLSAALQ
jgi:hypothetical protein